MLAPALPANEQARLDALRSLGLLDAQNEERFSRYVRLAKALIDVPVATVSLVDSKWQRFNGAEALGISDSPRDVSFCGHAILEQGVFHIPDAAADPRFADNPMVTGAPHIRFYAGCPIYVPGNLAIGTLCVIDRRPRVLDGDQLLRLRDLADCLQRELCLHILMQDIGRFINSAALTALSNGR